MKKFAIGAVILAVSLSLFPPALASAETTSNVTEVAITAPDATLTADSPTVTTEPAPIAAPEPVAATEPVVASVAVTPEPVTAPVAVVTAPAATEPVPTPAATPTATEPVVVAPTATEPPIDPVCMEDAPCWKCAEMGNHICGRDEGYNLGMQLAYKWDLATVRDRYVTLQPVISEHRQGFAYVPSIVNPEYVYVFSLITAEMDDLPK